MTPNSYRDLHVWQKAMGLALGVYRLTGRWPDVERFGLTAQARRAAVSIAANIAEGWGRGAVRELDRYLSIARGSAAEVETLLELATRLRYPGTPDADLAAHADSIQRMICTMRRRRHPAAPTPPSS